MITPTGTRPVQGQAGPRSEPHIAGTPRYVELQRLDWDTAFFGVPMGSIVAADNSDFAPRDWRALAAEICLLLERARTEDYAHLIFRTDADDMKSIWAAETAGLRLVDVGIDSTFRFDMTALPQQVGDLAIRPVQPDDVSALRDLAGDAFVVSRFATDPFFSPASVSAFYREWVTNLCSGLAQVVLVCEGDRGPAGFVSCSMTGDEGRIPLIATRAGDRRRGIGRGLVSEALHWFAAAGARVAHVKTQSANYPALALYHRAGFIVSRSELTFSIPLSGQTPQNLTEAR